MRGPNLTLCPPSSCCHGSVAHVLQSIELEMRILAEDAEDSSFDPSLVPRCAPSEPPTH